MTLVDVARLVSSEAGASLAALCRHYNLDPAAAIGLDDDFLGWQLRYGLAVRDDDTPEDAQQDRMAEGLARIAEARSAMAHG